MSARPDSVAQVASLGTGGPVRTLRGIRVGPRTGEPVLLLHSAGLDLTYWDGQIAALRPDHDVVALDFPGHGRTPGTPGDWQVETVTDLVAGTLAAIGAGSVHAVGLSVGGVVAQSLAIRHPRAVRSLALLDTAASFPGPGVAAMRARAAAAREGGMAAVLEGLIEHWVTPQTLQRRPALRERLTATVLGDDHLVHAAMWEMIASTDLRAGLPGIAVPTTVIVGELDSSSPVASSEALRDGIAGAVLHVVPGAAHLSPLEEPEQVNRHLQSFLSSLS